jgi:hypothetical protein
VNDTHRNSAAEGGQLPGATGGAHAHRPGFYHGPVLVARALPRSRLRPSVPDASRRARTLAWRLRMRQRCHDECSRRPGQRGRGPAGPGPARRRRRAGPLRPAMVTAWPPRTGHDRDHARAHGPAAPARDQRQARRGGPLTWAPASDRQPGGDDRSSVRPCPPAADACPDRRRLAPRSPLSKRVPAGRCRSGGRDAATFPARGRKQRHARASGGRPGTTSTRPRPSVNSSAPRRADCRCGNQ